MCQGDFLDTLGLVDLPSFNAQRPDTGAVSVAGLLEKYRARLDLIAVAAPLVSGRRRHYLDDLADKTRKLIKQLGGHPWEVAHA